MAKKKGFFANLAIAKEKAEEYAKSTLPTNRKEQFFDALKGNFGKLCGLNILILLTFLGVFALLLIKMAVSSTMGQLEAFNQSFGVGYPAVPEFVGTAENLKLSVDAQYLRFLPITMFLGAIGLSGGMYVIRNVAWGEGVFVANDFFKGVKKNYLICLAISALYSIFLLLGIILLDYSLLLQVTASKLEWLFVVSQVFIYAYIIFISIMALFMLSMAINYEMKFRHLLKNALLFTVGLFPINIVMVALCALPFIVFLLGSFITYIGLFLIVLFGFSFAMLLWTVYSHWVFDKHINIHLPKENQNRGIFEKQKAINEEELEKYKRAKATSLLSSRPIKPIDDDIEITPLTEGFRRADLYKLQEQKEVMVKDHEQYVAEHINDEQYVEVRKIMEENAVSNTAEEELLEMTRLELEGKKVKKKKKKKK